MCCTRVRAVSSSGAVYIRNSEVLQSSTSWEFFLLENHTRNYIVMFLITARACGRTPA